MIEKFRTLYSSLTQDIKRKLLIVQFILLLSSVAELIVVTIIPLYFIILDQKKIPNMSLEKVLRLLGLVDSNQINFIAVAWLFFFIILACNAVLVFANYMMLKVSADVGVSFSDSLLKYYLKQDYIQYLKNNKSEFTNDITVEVMKVQSGIIFQLLNLISKLLVISLIVGNLFLTNPVFTLKLVSIVFAIYLFFYKTIRRTLIHNGIKTTIGSARRHRYVAEALGSIKELKIYNKEQYFSDRHKLELAELLRLNAESAVLAILPKYVFETLAFGGLCFFLMQIDSKSGAVETSFSTLALYALSGYKLMPSAQQLFTSIASLRSHIHLVDKILDKVKVGQKITFEECSLLGPKARTLPKHKIELRNIFFSYNLDKNSPPQIEDLSISIPVGKKVAFVGSSGSGKTTTANILLGLLRPQSGELLVDDAKVNFEHFGHWLQNLSFVPQSIFLLDSSIAHNLAFGDEQGAYDLKRLEEVSEKANIKSYIYNLPEKFETTVGDDGVKLSGGQKQRLGLARALYFDRPVIIMDEATSSLDNISETEVMSNIQNLKDKTVIIIAHRLSTIKDCDVIFLFDKGKVISSGSYSELIQKSDEFSRLVSGQL